MRTAFHSVKFHRHKENKNVIVNCSMKLLLKKTPNFNDTKIIIECDTHESLKIITRKKTKISHGY